MSDRITVRIDGTELSGFSSIELVSATDAPGLFRLQVPWRDDQEFRQHFRPFQFSRTVVELDGEPILTGAQVNILPEATSDAYMVTVEGVSLPGLLHDCMMPPDSWPLEFSGQTLSEIAGALCEPFGVAVAPVQEQDDGPPFDRVRVEPTQRVLEAITQLAQQRGLLVSSTAEGELLLHRAAAPGSPAFRLGPGDSPRGGVRPNLNAQAYFSSIVGIQEARVGRRGDSRSAANPFAPAGLLRPHTFSPGDGEGASDLPTAVSSKLGRMLAGAATYAVSLPGWRSPTGELLRANSTIRLREPRAMIYTETEFLVRSVHLTATPHERYAELQLVLPGAFGGELPEVAPWEG